MKRFALLPLMLLVLALVAACGSSEEPAVEVEPTPGEATGLDGATILQEKCTGCHDLERVECRRPRRSGLGGCDRRHDRARCRRER